MTTSVLRYEKEKLVGYLSCWNSDRKTAPI